MPDPLFEFKEINSETALRGFLEKNGFRMMDSRSHADQYVLGAFVGKLDGQQAKITHRLFSADMEQTANAQRNQVILEIEGRPGVEVRFRGNY